MPEFAPYWFSIVVLGVIVIILLIRAKIYRDRFLFSVEKLTDASIKLQNTADEVYTVVAADSCSGVFGDAEQKKAMLGKNFLDYVAAEDRVRMLTVISRVEKAPGDSVDVQFRFMSPSGKIWLLSKIALREDGCIYCFGQNVTRLKKSEEDLRVSQEKFRLATGHMTELFFEFDIATKRVKLGENVKSEMRFSKSEFDLDEFINEEGIFEEDRKPLRDMFERMSCGENSANGSMRIKDVHGNVNYFKVAMTNIYDSLALPVLAVGTALNITAEKENEIKAEKERAHRESLMKQSLAAYIINLTERQVMAAYVDGRSISPTETGLDFLVRESERVIHEEEIDKMREWLNDVIFNREKDRGFITSYDYRRLVDGKYIWCSCSVSVYDEDDDKFALICVRDINARKLEEQALQYRAERDPLTGIFNRSSIVNYAADKIASAPEDKITAVFCMDIDDFKKINDRNGHAEGDRLLTELAGIFALYSKPYGEAGRIGGDEFMCVLTELSSKETAFDVADLFISAASKLTAADGNNVRISIGIGFAPDDGDSFAVLYKCADEALYEAKARGKNRYVSYEEKKESENAE